MMSGGRHESIFHICMNLLCERNAGYYCNSLHVCAHAVFAYAHI